MTPILDIPEGGPQFRVATVTLNPALDLTAGVGQLKPGAVNRVRWEQTDPGGKGLNVAAFLADFDVPVSATGFLGVENDQAFRMLMSEKAITDGFVAVEGRTRTNVKIIDEHAGEDGVTDINFPGFAVSPDDRAELLAAVERLAAHYDWFVLGGSLPPGIELDFYGIMVAKLRALGRKVILDATGDAARIGIAAGPTLIKPNLDELSEILGTSVSDAREAAAAARELHGRGIETVIVSMGAAGAVFSDGGQLLLAIPPKALVRSTVGAGDAMVAGYLAAKARGLDLAGAARLGTAFSLGALSVLGPRLPPRAEIERHLDTIRIETLSQ